MKQQTARFVYVLVLFLLYLGAMSEDNEFVNEHPNSIMHHSLHPPFIMDWWEGGLPNWDFGGAAVVTDGFIRLTPDEMSRHGWLWNERPNELDMWHLRLQFEIHGKKYVGADGFALWYVEKPERGDGPLYGMPIDFKGIGIVFDTYDNDGDRNSPSIALLHNSKDKDTPHFNPANDYKNEALARCTLPLRNVPEIEIDITYENKQLTVYVTTGNKEPYTCFKYGEIDLPTKYFFGLTAATGQISDIHDIHYIHFYPIPGHYTSSDYEYDLPELDANEAFLDPELPQPESKHHADESVAPPADTAQQQ